MDLCGVTQRCLPSLTLSTACGTSLRRCTVVKYALCQSSHRLSLSDRSSLFTQGKIRDRSHQLLGRILRAYGTCQGRAIKGIEILAVTSYDAAFDGLLAQGSSSFRQHSRTLPVEFLLDTMIVLWMKPSHSLRYQLESIRNDRYYNVEALWRAVEPHVNDRKQTDNSVRLLCELLPLMAFWDPAAMTSHLDPILRFLTERKAAQGKSCALVKEHF
jgi:hypothetical protein